MVNENDCNYINYPDVSTDYHLWGCFNQFCYTITCTSTFSNNLFQMLFLVHGLTDLHTVQVLTMWIAVRIEENSAY